MKHHETAKPYPPWHSLSPEEVIASLGSSRAGLSRNEALRRLAEGQGNALPTPEARSLRRGLLDQLRGPISILLLGVGVLSLSLGHWIDGCVLLGVVLLNAGIGLVHERNATRSMEALRNHLRAMVTVTRDGVQESIDAEGLVPGDLVFLEAGQRVAADLRLLESTALHIDESSLTGETLPSAKRADVAPIDANLADRHSMAFAGTVVSSGAGCGIVANVGTSTVLGRVSQTLSTLEEIQTPLLRQLESLAKWLTGLIVVAALGTFFYGLYVGALSSSELFLASVAFAAAAIPEGLSAALTIALGAGARKMAGQRAIVRRLPVVEALGSVTVICADKTGTLTTNEMTVEEVVTSSGSFLVTGCGWNPSGELKALTGHRDPQELYQLCLGGLLCSDARLHRVEQELWRPEGDPTEAALVVLAQKVGLEEALRDHHRRVKSLPFDHGRGWMATVHCGPAERRQLWVKGSPEAVIDLCHYDAAGPLRKQWWQQEATRLARRGLRVLAIADRMLESDLPESAEHLGRLVQSLTLRGLVAMADPPHPEVESAISACRAAGIELKMITGDHLETACAIAKRIGLIDPTDSLPAITGAEWKKAPKQRLTELAQRHSIFARTDPAQKLEIVQALQRAGEVVAMTGDGVNDAAALKQAEVGIALGCDSADAAKEAASIVLTQGRFEAIAQAIAEGRTIYENIQKFVLFLLSTGASEAFLAASAIFTGGLLPLLPTQILWINLASTLVLGMALAFGESSDEVMERAPRHPREPLLPHDLKLRLAWAAAIGAAFPLLFFDWALDHGRTLEEARSLAMTVLMMGEVALLMSLQRLHGAALDSMRSVAPSPAILAAAFGGLLLQVALLYVPLLQQIFQTAPLLISDWLAVLACWGCQMVAFEWLKSWSLVHPLATQQKSSQTAVQEAPSACAESTESAQE
jgi:magnesium-transporting ATPase (P-type)